MSQTISITELAAAKVIDFATREAAPNTLRVGLRGGGCSGFQYQLAFDNPRDDDQVIEQHGVRLLVSNEHIAYLDGSVIDYVTGLNATGFKVDNPNAVGTCGCGDSFRVDEACSSGVPDAQDVYL